MKTLKTIPPVSVFLPVRWIEYNNEKQVIPGQPDYDEKICRELESDRKQLQYFLKFVEEQGAPLGEDLVGRRSLTLMVTGEAYVFHVWQAHQYFGI
jgi:hypothetical protein